MARKDAAPRVWLIGSRLSQGISGEEGVADHLGRDVEGLVVDRLARGRGAMSDLAEQVSAGRFFNPIFCQGDR